MDAEVGEFNKDDKNLGKGKAKAIDAEGEGFNEEGKSLRDKETLKRPIGAVDAIDDEDSDENEFPILDKDGRVIIYSDIAKTFEHPNFKNITSRLEGDGLLAEHFGIILNILKKEDITSGDLDDFNKVVEDVLGNDNFLAELYREFEDEMCIAMVQYCAKNTQARVDKEGTKGRMALIRGDNYFSHASAGEKSETIIRGAISIIVSYCLSLTELRKIWKRGHDDEQFRLKFGLKDFD